MSIKTIILIVIIFAAGYFLGNFFPLPVGSPLSESDILGDTELRITVLQDDVRPVAGIEVDVAEKPGAPPQGGIAQTDEGGTAVFFVKPGVYYVYFNMSNFPADLQPLEEGSKRIVVGEGRINEETIILYSK